jgi:hypothetical protein
MFGSFIAKLEISRLRAVLVALVILFALTAIGVTLALTAQPHLTTDLGSGTAWAHWG